jgi:hypothetical protein
MKEGKQVEMKLQAMRKQRCDGEGCLSAEKVQ